MKLEFVIGDRRKVGRVESDHDVGRLTVGGRDSFFARPRPVARPPFRSTKSVARMILKTHPGVSITKKSAHFSVRAPKSV